MLPGNRIHVPQHPLLRRWTNGKRSRSGAGVPSLIIAFMNIAPLYIAYSRLRSRRQLRSWCSIRRPPGPNASAQENLMIDVKDLGKGRLLLVWAHPRLNSLLSSILVSFSHSAYRKIPKARGRVYSSILTVRLKSFDSSWLTHDNGQLCCCSSPETIALYLLSLPRSYG